MDLETLIGKVVNLTGSAREAKGGPVIITDENDVIYVKGLPEWSEEYLDKRIKISGLLNQEKLIPDPVVDEKGAISAGAYGLQWVLKDVNFSFLP